MNGVKLMLRKFIIVLSAAVQISAVALAGEPLKGSYDDPAKWTEDDPRLAVYYHEEGGKRYEVAQVNASGFDVETESIPVDRPLEQIQLRFLMINGGFVPNAEIAVENGRTLVPIRVISESLGAKVDWHAADRSVSIADGGTIITLRIGEAEAEVNGVPMALDAPARIISDKACVPMRFIGEALKADVGYADSIGDWGQAPRNHFSIVTVERGGGSAKYSIEDGLRAIEAESVKKYEQIVSNQGPIEEGQDYDPRKIAYINKNLGRYYLYRLERNPELLILYNSQTGEISSQHVGNPVIYFDRGFINLNYLI
jgi:hypothetical protein